MESMAACGPNRTLLFAFFVRSRQMPADLSTVDLADAGRSLSGQFVLLLSDVMLVRQTKKHSARWRMNRMFHFVPAMKSISKNACFAFAYTGLMHSLGGMISLLRQFSKCWTRTGKSTPERIALDREIHSAPEPWPPQLHGTSSTWPEILDHEHGNAWPRPFV
jgi:hypothetical protein